MKGNNIWLAIDWLKEAVKACKALKPWSDELGDFDILKYPNIPFPYKDAVKHLGIEKDQDEKLLLAKAFLKAFPYGGSGDNSYSFSSPGRPNPEDLVRFEKVSAWRMLEIRD